MIRIHNLQRTYRMGKVDVPAVRDVSFSVKKGEFVAIMGPSGSGKSTLLRQIGLLDQPTGGTLHVDDTNLLTLGERQKTRYRLTNFGFVFQEYALLEELTALENVYIPLYMQGKSKDECARRGSEMLDLVGLGDRKEHCPHELSGGQQQRVAIARALVGNPRILFADEPCANLDSQASKQVLDTFRKLNTQYNQTILMVTHEDWHKKYAKLKRIINMEDGRMKR